MKYTSAQAAKLLRKLDAEKEALETAERKTSVFTAATTEDKEAVRPDYDYEATQAFIIEIDRKIRAVKHAISRFNLETEIPGFDGMTIDQALVYLPQLKVRKNKYASMMQRIQKGERIGTTSAFGRQSAAIEYSYPNYDVKAAAESYEAVSEELARLQVALDKVNSTEELEIDV